MQLKKALRQNAARLVAIAAILTLFLLSQQPVLSAGERQALAADFAFSSTTMPELSGYEYHQIRNVHPDLKQIDGWLSAMGAAVALNDLDGDGLPNDSCQVDIRIDQAIVAPVPGSPARFAPFALNPGDLDYDPVTMAPVGCLPNDMNEDGRMDILVYYWGRTPIAFLNTGGPEAAGEPLSNDSYTPIEILPGDDVWWSSAATFADLDGDGHADLIVANYFPDDKVLLGSEGTDLVNMQRSMSKAFNGGGTYFFLWNDATSGPNPDVQFTKVDNVLEENQATAWTLALGAADLNGDLLPELYFANDYGPDRFFYNRSQPGELNFTLLKGRRDLTTPKSKVLGNDSFKGMGVDFGDVNGDGVFDMFVSNIAADYALHESHFMFLSTGETEKISDKMDQGVAPYRDASEPLGVARSSWGWEAKLADFNNDGTLEAIQATGFMKGDVNRWPELQELGLGSDELIDSPGAWPRLTLGDDLNGSATNPFYVRSKSGRFFDLAPELGLDQEQVTRGIATADVDGDGDLDFAIANQWASSLFYENECPDCDAFLGLRLLLPVASDAQAGDSAFVISDALPGGELVGSPAIGAVARVRLPDGRALINMVDGGNGQSGARSSDIHFGLGAVDPGTELTVELSWRDRSGQVRNETIQVTSGWHTVLLGES